MYFIKYVFGLSTIVGDDFGLRTIVGDGGDDGVGGSGIGAVDTVDSTTSIGISIIGKAVRFK